MRAEVSALKLDLLDFGASYTVVLTQVSCLLNIYTFSIPIQPPTEINLFCLLKKTPKNLPAHMDKIRLQTNETFIQALSKEFYANTTMDIPKVRNF